MKTFLPPPRNRMAPIISAMKVNQRPIEIAKEDFFSCYRISRKLGIKLVTRGWGKEKLRVWRVK